MQNNDLSEDDPPNGKRKKETMGGNLSSDEGEESHDGCNDVDAMCSGCDAASMMQLPTAPKQMQEVSLTRNPGKMIVSKHISAFGCVTWPSHGRPPSTSSSTTEGSSSPTKCASFVTQTGDRTTWHFFRWLLVHRGVSEEGLSFRFKAGHSHTETCDRLFSLPEAIIASSLLTRVAGAEDNPQLIELIREEFNQ
ncbi:MAG: hypothetical protein SGPRY_002158 [Prymnesium sp.]